MLGSNVAVGCSKGQLTIRFPTKGTTRGVRSEVMHTGMKLREGVSLMMAWMGFKETNKKQSQRPKPGSFCSDAVSTRYDKACDRDNT